MSALALSALIGLGRGLAEPRRRITQVLTRVAALKLPPPGRGRMMAEIERLKARVQKLGG